MNKEAVKQLTEQGCMVGRDAAEILEEEDIPRINSLEAKPMYVSRGMIEKVRQKVPEPAGEKPLPPSGAVEQETSEPEAGTNPREETQDYPDESEGSEASGETGTRDSGVEDNGTLDSESEESDSSNLERSGSQEGGNTGPEEEYEYSRKSSYFDRESTVVISDDGERGDLNTKVEVLDDYEVTRDEKDVPEFLGYYNDRYEKMRKMLMRRSELKSATSIERLERRDEGDQAAAIGLVKDKYSTSSDKFIVSLEDKTGSFKLLVDEREGRHLVQDEMIGVTGSMGGDILYANSVVKPDLPIPDGVNTTKEEVKAAYISDLHIGSEDTLHDRLDRFADWLGTSEASKIGYLVMPGDVIEGVGVYPGQKDELQVNDIYKQYEMFEDWIDRIPEDIQIIFGPGNHDITRLAEPQPKINEDVFDRIDGYRNVHIVRNPQTVRLHGIRSKGITNLMYHGYSFDDHIDEIKELRENAYDEPYRVMVDLLKRRHLAPTYGSNLLSPEPEDHLVIDKKPDVFVAGHLHSHSNYSYKGVNVIASSTFQAQTEFQKRVGHEPDPGKVTVVNYENRNTEVHQF